MGLIKRQVETFETILEDLAQLQTRWIIRRSKQTPYLQARDTKNHKSRKQVSLSPLSAWGDIEDMKTAQKLVEYVGSSDWPDPKKKPIEVLIKEANGESTSLQDSIIYDWEEIKTLAVDHINKTMKGSSRKNVNGHINNLVNNNIEFNWDSIKNWLYEKEIGKSSFKNRLDSLEQIRLSLTNKNGNEPDWLKRGLLDNERKKDNESKKKRTRYKANKGMADIRAIPTRKEAEQYLDELWPDYPLEQWCIAMMLCYGLRNHELHHIKKLDKNFIFIPGVLTKSKEDHDAWPLYPSWVIRFGLFTHFDQRQEELRSKARIKINYDLSDEGVGDNNSDIGSWITRRMRNNLPALMASIPDAKGNVVKNAKRQRVRPYDLRHTWAIRISTEPEWSHVSEIDAAKAMGHDLTTHRKNYQRWVSKEAERKRLIERIKLPNY